MSKDFILLVLVSPACKSSGEDSTCQISKNMFLERINFTNNLKILNVLLISKFYYILILSLPLTLSCRKYTFLNLIKIV